MSERIPKDVWAMTLNCVGDSAEMTVTSFGRTTAMRVSPGLDDLAAIVARLHRLHGGNAVEEKRREDAHYDRLAPAAGE